MLKFMQKHTYTLAGATAGQIVFEVGDRLPNIKTHARSTAVFFKLVTDSRSNCHFVLQMFAENISTPKISRHILSA